MPRMIRACLLTLLCGFALAACNLSREAPPKDATAAGEIKLRLDALQEQARPLPTQIDLPVSKPTPSPEPERCGMDAPELARQIQADVQINYDARTAQVSQRIDFYNFEDAPLDSLVVDAQPNQYADAFTLDELRINRQSAEYTLEQNRLDIPLATPLESGCSVAIALDYQLRPHEIREGLQSLRGFFGYSARQLNLSHFLPTVAARLAGDWRIHRPSGIGEQIVYEPADWQAQITVEGASESLQLAAPGRVTQTNAGQWQVDLPASRDFAMSLSDDFILTEREVAPGLSVAVYSFGDSQLDSAGHLLSEAGKALEHFSRSFGKYPYDRFVIVQGDFPDGMEFSGLVYVGSAWFYGFNGTPKNYLTLIAVHEIAHQWWYARVGSDSALTPWLDEALATYSEYLYIEAFYPAEKNWWWTFRVAGFFPQGEVDSAVYEFSTARAYINAVYLRGVQMLHNLRDDIGDAAFMELLRAYSEAGEGKIADPALFWEQLPADQLERANGTRAEFFREP